MSTPQYSKAAVESAIRVAYDPVVVSNALTNPPYSPYCMRCTGLERMKPVGLLHWSHYCGAVHDEADARAALLNSAKATGAQP